MYVEMENGDSPIHIACTQEASTDVDVVWDWNSPQAKQKPRRINKSLISTRSPKIPLKRHSSNNQIQNFDKLREELKCLKEAISVPDHEESLILSPVQEDEYKDINNFQNREVISPPHEHFPTQEDLFDDSVDEQLLLFSQKLEAEMCRGQVKEQLLCNSDNTSVESLRQECALSNVKISDMGSSNTVNMGCTNLIPDDSFNDILETFNTEFNDSFTAVFDRTISAKDIKDKHIFIQSNKGFGEVSKNTTSKVEFHRTKSFETTLEHTIDQIPKTKLDEIERKRREALVKLESKRKLESNDTPTKCTPQEIEQKRLEALAKREAKRQQELIIERKRKDALKRLEMSRKKNATIVKSSLTKRL